MGPSSVRVVTDSKGAGAKNCVLPVAMSTVRMELVPSRKRLVYGLIVAIATVLPFEEKEGRPGKKVRGASGFTAPVATSRVKVAPVWSWNAMSFPSGDQAGMIWAVLLGAGRLSAVVSGLDMS